MKLPVFTDGRSTDPFMRLINVMQNDCIIKNRIKKMLELDSFNRRTVLNRWLEQLRRKNASENLRQALSCLFDDNVAKKVLTIINNHRTLNK